MDSEKKALTLMDLTFKKNDKLHTRAAQASSEGPTYSTNEVSGVSGFQCSVVREDEVLLSVRLASMV